MPLIPPELREDRGEIELALKNNLPQVVEYSDIKGDLHVHSHVTEGGIAPDGYFHKISRSHDDTLREFFTREVFSLLLREKLIRLSLVQKILAWRHTGFNVHSQVRAQTKRETERVGKYMIRPLLSLKRLLFGK